MEINSENPEHEGSSREFDYREVKRRRKINPLFLIIPAGLIIAVLASFFLLNSKSKTSDNSSNKSVAKTTTISAKKNSGNCPGKTEIENIKQGYRSCYTTGWILKELKVSGLSIGLDPKQVDANFPGTITVTVSDNPEAATVQDISDNTSKFEFGPVNVDGIKATQVTFTRLKADSLFSSAPMGITTVVTNFSRSYSLTLNSSEANYATNKTLYESFLSDFKFIAKTASPPWSESRNILVNSPWTLDSITSPVEVSGEAVAFEGTVNIRIKDSAGHVLVETTTQTEAGNERSAFKISLDFGKPTTKKGTVEIFTLSAKDGSEQDKVTVPVVFP